ncbi:hypothetical protein D3C72_1013030 [compost metagenome]
METGGHEEGRAIDRILEVERRMHVFVNLHGGEQDAERNGEHQTGDQALAVIVQQGMVGPGDAGARQKQDDGVVERQMPGIDDLDALWRPLPAGIFEAGRLNGLVREEAGIEIGPEPRDEEHHF